ncbi:MAG: putative S-layer protein [Candidatus Saganbacteria bacterium]|uniref:Putative S-layer protein n=1 Tax=Candidatus Saganbacteria bacterium TaxID=2575572 RepID=A0A833L169_UNCSA|nr:MAG: putative S-layer protein [Candidatus Saganbacteria bacterium]
MQRKQRRKQPIKYLIVIFMLLFIFPSCSFADSTKVANDPTRLGVGARVLGMGKAFIGQADDISSIFTNPAGLSRISELQLTSMSGKFINEINYLNVGGVMPSSAGSFGIGYINSDVGFSGQGFTTEVVDGVRIIPTASNSSYNYKNSAITLNYGTKMPFINNLDIGTTFKIFFQEMSGPGVTAKSASGYDADLGIKYTLNRFFSLGAVAQNIIPSSAGGKITWNTGTVENLPHVLRFGTNLKILGEKGLINFRNQELSLNIDGDVTPARPTIPSLYHYGLEWSPIEFLDIRTGIDQEIVGKGGGLLEAANNFTAGIGINFRGFRFDYAYHQYYSLSDNDTHYFSLSYGIYKNKPTPEVKALNYFDITEPKDKSFSYENNISIVGKINRAEVKKILINGSEVNAANNSFKTESKLTLGKNKFEVVGLNSKGNVLEKEKVRVCHTLKYNDIPENYWGKDKIDKMSSLGILNGYPDHSFRPSNKITRAELIKCFVKISDIPLGTSVKPDFSDVDEKYWAAPYIEAGVKNTFMTGFPDKTFRPEDSISRAQSIKGIVDVAKLDKGAPVYESPFIDIPGRYELIKEINAAYIAGLLKYLKGKAFEPNKPLMRGEAVEILSNIKFVSDKINSLSDWDNY